MAKFLQYPAICISTFFFIGFVRKAPGTWGSLAGLLVGVPVLNYTGMLFFIFFVLFVFFLGSWACNYYIKSRKDDDHDPGEIVIDEVVGIWLTIALFPPSLNICILAFIFFRLFDIWKPWPISWVDKSVSNFFGIMLDDVVASIFSILCIYICVELNFV